MLVDEGGTEVAVFWKQLGLFNAVLGWRRWQCRPKSLENFVKGSKITIFLKLGLLLNEVHALSALRAVNWKLKRKRAPFDL